MFIRRILGILDQIFNRLSRIRLFIELAIVV
jgi:hypothetical protein